MMFSLLARGRPQWQLQGTAPGEHRQFLVALPGDVLAEAALGERFVSSGRDKRQRDMAVAMVFIGENLPGFGVWNLNALMVVHGQCFHGGKFPHPQIDFNLGESWNVSVPPSAVICWLTGKSRKNGIFATVHRTGAETRATVEPKQN